MHFKNIRGKLWHHIQTLTRRLGLNVSTLILDPINENNASCSIKDIKILINEQSCIDKNERVFDSLKALDRGNLSYESYKTVRSNLNYIPNKYRMPGINKVVEMKKKVDRVFEIKQSTTGFYVNTLQKIRAVCLKYLDNHRAVKNDTFTIKLSCDGTIISKANVHLLNFTFTLINDEQKCKTASGNYILGK